MEQKHLNCPYCGNPFRKGAILIEGKGNAVSWVSKPRPLGRTFYWRVRERLFSSFISTYRNALWCKKCHLVIFDTRDPKNLQIVSPNGTGPWKHLFPQEEGL